MRAQTKKETKTTKYWSDHMASWLKARFTECEDNRLLRVSVKPDWVETMVKFVMECYATLWGLWRESRNL